jgi:hypothetical protein
LFGPAYCTTSTSGSVQDFAINAGVGP